ncbi:Meprin A subunit beta [Homalodisca vitripennis]|nr:Meprin A subunit beta [Homalodisca vitripennis]
MWADILNLLLLFPALGLALPFGKNNTETSIFVCESEPDVDTNIIEMSISPTSGLGTRSFLLNKAQRWTHGIVPYEIDPSFSEVQVAKINDTIQLFSDVSCVKWVPRYKHNDYVKFVHSNNKKECNSYLGRKGGEQVINLGDDCFDYNVYRGAIPHEMMHALGFIHEQQRVDRDCFVKVTQQASCE